MTLEELVLKVTADTSEVESGFSKIGQFASAAGKAIGAGLAAGATAVAALAKSSIEAYADYEQLTGGVETLFKNSAGIVEEYAANAYKTAGLSANQYMETVTSFSASLLQSLGGDTEAAAKVADMAITDMADNANKMGTSMESIQSAYQGFAKQNYTMLDNLKLGYGGTKSEMERLLADATALSGIEYDISNLNDVYEAIHVIQTELDITGTTAKEASTTISGSLSSMKSAWQNVLVGISDDNADFESLINNLVESVGTFAKNIIPRIQSALKGIGKLVADLAPVIAAELPALMDAILPSLLEAAVSLIDSVVQAIPEILPALLDAVTQAFMAVIEIIATEMPTIIDAIIEGLVLIMNAVSENLPEIVNAVVEGLIGLVEVIIEQLPIFIDAFITLIGSFIEAITVALPQIIAALPTFIQGIIDAVLPHLPEFIQMFVTLLTALIQAIPEILAQILPALPDIIYAILDTLLGMLPLLIEAGITLFVALVEALPEIIQQIVAVLPDIIDAIIGAIMDNLPLIIEAGVDLFVALIENLPTIIVEIVKAVPKIIAEIVKAIIEAIPQIIDAGFQLVTGLFNGISNATQWLYNKISGWVSGVLGWIKGLFGIASPSKVFASYGKFMDEGLGQGLEKNAKYATDALTDVAEQMENAFDPHLAVPTIEGDFEVDTSRMNNLDANLAAIGTYEVSGATLENQSRFETIMNDNHEDIISTLTQLTQQLINVVEDINPSVVIGDEVIAASAARGNNSFKRRTGKPLFA